MAVTLRAPVMAKSAGSGATAAFTEVPSVQVSSVEVGGETKMRAGRTVAVRASLSSPNQEAAVVSPPGKVQMLHVLEINDKDRDSPAYLHHPDKATREVLMLGDLVPFTNTVYNMRGTKYLGITSGICLLIERETGSKGDRFEAIYSFYFGKHGHISVQGPYMTCEESNLAITGGSGVFEGVYGQVKLKPIIPFSRTSCTFYLKGIPDLPPDLLRNCQPVDQPKSRL